MSGVFSVTMFRERDCTPCAVKAAVPIMKRRGAVTPFLFYCLTNTSLTSRGFCCYAPKTAVNRQHRAMPRTVGSRKARAVHLRLPVSRRMVSRVVEQGQWSRVNSSILTALCQVQPLDCKTVSRLPLSTAVRLPWAR